ncbi:hypothetical protein K388_06351 [Streptomyces sp. KhCrAH-43]|uniref:hypothetical protein n=1 Tax=unclassified Streptomyces TaxID=2593676 RepID=UPI00037FA189|nr:MULTISPECIES: hypothetical protein [unclassified Streptomyces]MYS34435.1 hypothetical protein [Streptomyces sp. SID4920]MYX64526.1 hypothetical protein [Streptomyces sp. SID8373]RAJ51055.1 hypothetical protein K388_06351 [Streptomyces sp. KhCrAH-43]
MNEFEGGGGRHLSMTNGGTAVFVDVLTFAVSELALKPWDFRFAALLSLQNQNVMGRGVVGFALEELDWGDSPQEADEAKDFLLRVLDLALTHHRWDELTYEPPRVEGYVRTYRAMVEDFDPATARAGEDVLPGPQEAARASCVRHRVLNGLPFWEECVFCTDGL